MLEGLVAAGFYSCFFGRRKGVLFTGAGAGILVLAAFLLPEIRYMVPTLTAIWIMTAGFRYGRGRREDVFLAGGIWLMAWYLADGICRAVRSLTELWAGRSGEALSLSGAGPLTAFVYPADMSAEGVFQESAGFAGDIAAGIGFAGGLQTSIAVALLLMAALCLLGRGKLYPLWIVTLALLWMLTGYLGSIAYAKLWQRQTMAFSLYLTTAGILACQQISCARQALERAFWDGDEVIRQEETGRVRKLRIQPETGKERQLGREPKAGNGKKQNGAGKWPLGRSAESSTGKYSGRVRSEKAAKAMTAEEKSRKSPGTAAEGKSRKSPGTQAEEKGQKLPVMPGKAIFAGESSEWREAADREFRHLQIFDHDFRHHLDVIAALYEAGSPAEARAYMEDLKQARVSRQGRRMGGERELSYIMMAKKENCRQAEIAFSYQILGSPRGIAQMDMTALLLNLLDNAIRACREVPQPRSISVMLLSRGQLWEIEIINSGHYEPKRGNQGSGQKGTDGAVHGIGLVSVGQIVAKYQGSSRIWQEEGRVRQKLILVQRVPEETG